jgi:RNA-directed DNA polymerase
MAKADSKLAVEETVMPEDAPVNTGAPWPSLDQARQRVLEIQTKLHRWAAADPSTVFDDVFNLVADPGFLLMAWDRVRNNTGARTAGVDGWSAHQVEVLYGVEDFLRTIRQLVKSGQFRPRPVRERLIPKPGRVDRRRLGIPTVIDRVVQAALKLVLEPIFEADFRPYSYGFRPRRRAQDAITEIHLYTSLSYEWVLEADIETCFDSISHTALLARIRGRVADRRVLALVKAFLKAGVLKETGDRENTVSGTPQGGILSPLLANITLTVLDDFAYQAWQGLMSTSDRRKYRRKKGLPNWRLVRYADDFVVVVAGNRQDAENLRGQVAEVLAVMGLRLSPAKTRVVHIDEGFDFLGFRIQRHPKRGTNKKVVYTYPSKKALASIVDKVRTLTSRRSSKDLATVLKMVNARIRGWCNYFKHGASKQTFSYLDHYTWRRMAEWIRNRHPGLNWRTIKRRYMGNAWKIAAEGTELFKAASIPVTRYRYRGAAGIPNPWKSRTSTA